MPVTRDRAARWAAIAAAWVSIGIHLDLVNDHLNEKFYIGVLFVIGAALLIPVVLGLASGRLVRLAWALGIAVNAGMVGGFLASRTIGLPEGYVEGWATDHALGLVSTGVELVFLVAAAVALLGTSRVRVWDRLPAPVASRS